MVLLIPINEQLEDSIHVLCVGNNTCFASSGFQVQSLEYPVRKTELTGKTPLPETMEHCCLSVYIILG